MLEKQDLMSHTYDEFIHGIEQFYTKLKELR